jgi:hypothetical protein
MFYRDALEQTRLAPLRDLAVAAAPVRVLRSVDAML